MNFEIILWLATTWNFNADIDKLDNRGTFQTSPKILMIPVMRKRKAENQVAFEETEVDF